MKLLDDIMGLLRRYAPTLIVHLLFFLWLSQFVLDPRTIPSAASVWPAVSGNIDAAFKAVGLSLERWYVIAAFLLTYLTAFEWLRSLILNLPLFRIVFAITRDPDLLATACKIFQMPPDYWRVYRALSLQIDRCTERVRQNNQRHPYQWLIDRQALLKVYYGNLLIAFVAMCGWAVAGSTHARSPSRVFLTIVLLGAGALVLRWAIRYQHAKCETRIGYWALNEFERTQGEHADDPLRYNRQDEMLRRAKEEDAIRRHPATLLSNLVGRLPLAFARRLRKWIVSPDRHLDEIEWAILASSRTCFSAETVSPPAALVPTPFANRFAALLERPGAGLCMLATERSGIAPAAPRGGAVYAFATRRHDYGYFGVSLDAWDGLDATPVRVRLSILTGDSHGFIARIGDLAIEQLMSNVLPYQPGKGWLRLFSRDIPDGVWLLPDEREPATVEGIEVARSVDLEWGASYLLGLKTNVGTEARIILQCFRVEGSQRVLIAWSFLDVRPKVAEGQRNLPWWRPSAWKNVLRTPAERASAG